MNFKKLLSQLPITRIICIAILLVSAILSITVVAKIAADPQTYAATIESIDDKKAKVGIVTAATAGAATVLATIPGDATTPIANQIIELTTYLFIVVCALLLEKSLLTILGFTAFTFVFPAACVILGVYVFKGNKKHLIFALKLAALALVMTFIIPLGMKLGDMVYDVNSYTVEQVCVDDVEASDTDTAEEDLPWLKKVVIKIKKTASDASDTAKQILNSFIDAIVVFVVSCCAIPLIIIVAAIGFINFLFGINIPIPKIDVRKLLTQKQDSNLPALEKDTIDV